MRTAHFTLAAAINMTRITTPDAFLVVYQQNGLACPTRQLLDRRARLARTTVPGQEDRECTASLRLTLNTEPRYLGEPSQPDMSTTSQPKTRFRQSFVGAAAPAK
jgi:hypothetical protein